MKDGMACGKYLVQVIQAHDGIGWQKAHNEQGRPQFCLLSAVTAQNSLRAKFVLGVVFVFLIPYIQMLRNAVRVARPHLLTKNAPAVSTTTLTFFQQCDVNDTS